MREPRWVAEEPPAAPAQPDIGILDRLLNDTQSVHRSATDSSVAYALHYLKEKYNAETLLAAPDLLIAALVKFKFLPVDEREQQQHIYVCYVKNKLRDDVNEPFNTLNYHMPDGTRITWDESMLSSYRTLCAATLDPEPYRGSDSKEEDDKKLRERLATLVFEIQRLSCSDLCNTGKRSALVGTLAGGIHPEIKFVADLEAFILEAANNWCVQYLTGCTEEVRFQMMMRFFSEEGMNLTREENKFLRDDLIAYLDARLHDVGVHSIAEDALRFKQNIIEAFHVKIQIPMLPGHEKEIQSLQTLDTFCHPAYGQEQRLQEYSNKIQLVWDIVTACGELNHLNLAGITYFTRLLYALDALIQVKISIEADGDMSYEHPRFNEINNRCEILSQQISLFNSKAHTGYMRTRCYLGKSEMSTFADYLKGLDQKAADKMKRDFTLLDAELDNVQSEVSDLIQHHDVVFNQFENIKNYFALYSQYISMQDESREKAALERRLKSITSESVFMDDVYIRELGRRLIKLGTIEGEAPISLYYINRILLHATIATPPHLWSPDFFNLFVLIIDLIKKLESGEKRETDVKRTSYPVAFVEQLLFLQAQYQLGRDNAEGDVTIPLLSQWYFACNNLILSPLLINKLVSHWMSNCRNAISSCMRLYASVNETCKLSAVQSLARHYYVTDDYSYMLRDLPRDERYQFVCQWVDVLVTRERWPMVQEGKHYKAILTLLPPSDGALYLNKLKSVIMNKRQLVEILICMISYETELRKLNVPETTIHNVTGFDKRLKLVYSLLPVIRHAYDLLFVARYLNPCHHQEMLAREKFVYRLSFRLGCPRPDQLIDLMQFIVTRSDEFILAHISVITSGFHFSRLLSKLTPESLGILIENPAFKEHLDRWIDGYDCAWILERIPDQYKLNFACSYTRRLMPEYEPLVFKIFSEGDADKWLQFAKHYITSSKLLVRVLTLPFEKQDFRTQALYDSRRVELATHCILNGVVKSARDWDAICRALKDDPILAVIEADVDCSLKIEEIKASANTQRGGCSIS